MTIEFEAWPKTTRLFRDITITEKIDGTNAAIIIRTGYHVSDVHQFDGEWPFWDKEAGHFWFIGAQSRNRLIQPGKTTDNAGFAQWVRDNGLTLARLLGEGRHFGEWWGPKVTKRNYGMSHKVFSIFDVDMWDVQVDQSIKHPIGDAVLTHTPVLYRGTFSEQQIMDCARTLKDLGSVAAYRFGIDGQEPEGICIFHSQSRIVQKFTFDNNDAGKWENL